MTHLSEITDFKLSIPIDQKIARFDVPMDDFVRVDKVDSIAQHE